jgi:molybdenum cofactor synthesis domain-containing protein
MSETATTTCCVLTVSDRCAAGEAEDTAGPALANTAQKTLHATIVDQQRVPDEPDRIQHVLKTWAQHDPQPDLVLTTGGTGLAPRDITPEVTASILERRHPGLLELARLRCYEKTPLTFLSRGEAGTIAKSLIINLPGSERGATEMLQSLSDVLPHAIATLRGDAADCGRAAPSASAPADSASDAGPDDA